MSIGVRIQEALEQSGKNRAQLARYLGTKDSTVSGWVIGGRIPLSDAIMPICEYTGVSPLWLLSGISDSSLEPHERQLLDAVHGLPPDKVALLVETAKAMR